MCVSYTKSKRLPVLSNFIELNYIFKEFSTINKGSKKNKVSLLSINIKEIKLPLRKNFPLFLNQFVPNLYNNSGVVVIGLMTSSTQVGMYDLLKKPVDLMINLISVLSKNIFIFMNRKNSSFEKYRRFMLGLSTILFILCLFVTIPFFEILNIPFTTR